MPEERNQIKIKGIKVREENPVRDDLLCNGDTTTSGDQKTELVLNKVVKILETHRSLTVDAASTIRLLTALP